ncbi:hypothetical protein SDC9_209474 [bioreactor metagenome]|uniref:Uncharacterized protein n=1 Tax=bioreactor metagenome TaxID=1076179 RepID=A0A645JEX9_9ZZZZ
MHIVHTEQELYERYEQHEDQQVIDRNLYKRMRRVAFCEVAPHEHHSRAGSGSQKHCARHEILRQARRN